MIILNSIATIIFVLYVIYIRIELGYFPKSLSQSFYDLKNKTGRFNWEFILTLIVASIVLVWNGFYYWKGGSFPLIIIGGFGILGVAQFALFKKKLIGVMHYINAIIGFTLSVLYFGINQHMWYIVIITAVIALIALILAKKGTKLFWLEVALSLCLIISLFLL